MTSLMKENERLYSQTEAHVIEANSSEQTLRKVREEYANEARRASNNVYFWNKRGTWYESEGTDVCSRRLHRRAFTEHF